LAIAAAACHTSSAAPAAPPAAKPAAPTPTPQQAEAPAPRIPTWPAYLGARFEPGTTRIVQLIPHSPAAASALHLGDEIVSIDGVAMTSSQQIVQKVTETQANTKVTVVIKREGAPMTLTIKLGARPPDEQLIRQTLLDRPAPAFTATTLDGKPSLKLADLRGRVVLVDFWATWCHPCIAQFPHLNEWHKKYAAKGLSIVALSNEEADLVRDYVAAEKLGFPVALDPDDRIRAAYIVPGMPTTVVIDKTGVVRYVKVGLGKPKDVEALITSLLE
jgi:thiol-disulfide isomerase/thioredoxin